MLVSPPFRTILFILFIACLATLSETALSWSSMAELDRGTAVAAPAARNALIAESLLIDSESDFNSLSGLLLAVHDSN